MGTSQFSRRAGLMGRVTITMLPDGQRVLIELDTDSNGTVDASTTRTWSELGI